MPYFEMGNCTENPTRFQIFWQHIKRIFKWAAKNKFESLWFAAAIMASVGIIAQRNWLAMVWVGIAIMLNVCNIMQKQENQKLRMLLNLEISKIRDSITNAKR